MTSPNILTAAINMLGLETLEHLPYRSDLASSDFYLIRPLKETLRVCRFAPNMDVKNAVHNTLALNVGELADLTSEILALKVVGREGHVGEEEERYSNI
ncbi:hypothetical protein TNIN_497551 [Trichonephila inaurata madagascariensis]|uniref:Uncharacterized protein n=1 Tax=Trichonephila inaurata madagascariensis TaxID=2747483 RepID=A0A8X6MIS7_9ARAC|nr:hypothetical protein TNIN_497551 [Trichonephila inaurata madagascariensis]